MDKNGDVNYNLPAYLRIIIVILVLVISFLSLLAAFPISNLMGVNPVDLQGVGFIPTFKTLTIVILYAASQFLLIWLVIRFVHRKALSSLGFKGPILIPLLIGTAVGMVMQAIEYLILHLTGSNISMELSVPANVSVLTIMGYFLLNLLFLLTLNSLKEELVFRTYPIEQFNDYPRFRIPLIIMVSLVFASVHHILLPFVLDDFVSRFTIAFLLSFVFYRCRSIWFIAGIHNGLNLLEYITGGNYKMGGLLQLSMEHHPSQAVSICVDFSLAFIFILIFNFILKEKNHEN